MPKNETPETIGPERVPVTALAFMVNDIAHWTNPGYRAVFLSAARQAAEWGLSLDQIEAIFRNAYDAAARNGHELNERWY